MAQERLYTIKTPVRDTSGLKQRLTDSDEAVEQWRIQLHACEKAKDHHYGHLLQSIGFSQSHLTTLFFFTASHSVLEKTPYDNRLVAFQSRPTAWTHKKGYVESNIFCWRLRLSASSAKNYQNRFILCRSYSKLKMAHF